MKFLLFCLLMAIPLQAKTALVVFVSNPETRSVKTRLAKELGEEEAEKFYSFCLEILTEDLPQLEKEGFTVFISPPYTKDVEWVQTRWLDYHIVVVEDSNLGVVMRKTVDLLLGEGFEQVFLIGSDAPTLPIDYITFHRALLDENTFVLGPAEDGGFYLLGATAPLPSIESVRWSTEYACADTCERLEGPFSLGPTWYDVDVWDDLLKVKRDLLPETKGRAELSMWLELFPKVSIIVPVLNEREQILSFCSSLLALKPKPEVIVVDGGSVDGTDELLQQLDVQFVSAPAGNRGRSMNVGAECARGNLLLFLHADTSLSQESYSAMIEAVEKGEIEGGTFSLIFENRKEDPRLVWVERGVFLRNHLLHLVYGDQAFFVKRDRFEPFADMPLMEDIEWFGRLKKKVKWRILKQTVATSPRRIYKKGICRSALTNTTLVLLYKMGVNPKRLANVYYQKKRIWKPNPIPSSSLEPDQEG